MSNQSNQPLSRYEALKLAIAATPAEIWNSDCYRDDSARIKYLFDVAALITEEDLARNGF